MENFTEKRKQLILKTLNGEMTANEIIDKIFQNDLKKYKKSGVFINGWKYYVHLNKLFAPLERENKIFHVASKNGEKLWSKNDYIFG